MPTKKVDTERLPIELQSAVIIASSNLAVYLTTFSKPANPSLCKELLLNNFGNIFTSIVEKIVDFNDISYVK
jgi:hypothetical protein